MNLGTRIACTQVKQGIALFWLGQAGFVVKDQQQNIVAIDPYLTDCGERLKGFKRLSPKLLQPSELEPDLYLTTHHHFDHFDYDAVPIVAASKQTEFFGPPSCVELYHNYGISSDRIHVLKPGMAYNRRGIVIRATFADHGTMAPDAVGLLLEMGNVKLYFSGDTAFHPERWLDVKDFEPDIAVLSINGKFGNLTPEEGAKLAGYLGAKVAIPCHFWTFAEHGGDPYLFGEGLKKYAPACLLKFMQQGEMFEFSEARE